MIIVSYYTKNTPYETVINKCLIPSLERFNLESDIQAIDDLGNWQNNTGYKSKLIRDMLLKHKQPVVFLDSDATIEQYPYLLYNIQDNIDIAYHHFLWKKHWRNEIDPNEKHQLLSGTMYFAYNERVLKLINEWIIKVDENINVWEQKTLEDLVNSKTDLKIENLPAEYCCVLMQDNSIPKYINNPIIVHHQASRKYKNRRLWT